MLFGGVDFESKLLKDAFDFAEKNGMRLLYGAVVGGISKGMHNFDSDYDTRFLYIRDDFPLNLQCPATCRESHLIKRYYILRDDVYEWIPYWETSSFFRFLFEPVLDGRRSIGLYGTVLWTMMSPYTWDPFGIQIKLIPIINKYFDLNMALEYYLMMLKNYQEYLKSERVFVKKYIYAIHAAASIEWVLRYREMPPVHIKTLSSVIDNESVKCGLDSIINEMRNNALGKNCLNNASHDTHFKMLTTRIKEVDDFITDCFSRATAAFDDNKKDVFDKEAIDSIIDVINDSINDINLNP